MSATLASSLPVYLVGALAVQIRQSLRFGPGALGLASGLYFVAAAGSSIPMSWVSERIGGAAVLRIGALLEGVTLVALGVASRSWAALAGLLVLAGALAGWISPASYLFLSESVVLRRQGRAFGVNQAAVPLAPLLGGLAVPALALTVGWRWAFVVAGVLSMLVGRLVPPTPPGGAGRQERSRSPVEPGPPLRFLPLIILGAGLGLGMFEASALVTFLSSGAVALGMRPALAGYLVAGASLAAVLARLSLGAVADRRGGDHFGLVALTMALGAVALVVLGWADAGRISTVFAATALVAVGLGWGWNALLNFAVVRSHAHAPARATGVTDVGGRLGGMLGPVVTGLVIAHGSYAEGWLVLAVALALAAGLVSGGRRLLARSAPEARPSGS